VRLFHLRFAAWVCSSSTAARARETDDPASFRMA
jgi:hypothetical protein